MKRFGLALVALLLCAQLFAPAHAQTGGHDHGYYSSLGLLNVAVPPSSVPAGDTASTKDSGHVWNTGTAWVPLLDGQTPGTLTNKVLPYVSNTFSGFPVFVPCTNAFAVDDVLLTNAFALGGGVILTGNCQVAEAFTLISNTDFNLNGYTVTQAAASNWSGSTVVNTFVAANNATNITIENGSIISDTGSTGSVHLIQFPSGNSHVAVLNMYMDAANATGDCEAMVGVTDGKVLGNTCIHFINSAYDNWNGTQDVEIAGNYASTATSGTSAIYPILWTGFNTNDTAGTLTTHANIHDNKIYINNQATFGDIGVWLQGYSSCTGAAADYADVHDNEFFIATGIWAEAVRADGCANHDSIHDNIIFSDGTASSLPAIEAKATTTDIHIDNNKAVNFSAPTSGSDAGIFNNESANGTLLNDTCTGASCSAVLYAGQVAGSTSDQPFTKPYNRWQWGVAAALMSSATMGANGAYSAATSQPITASPGFWGWFPAGYICSTGQSAGVFWVVPSSATAGQIFNTTLTAGTAPFVPASPTAFSCSAGSGTQTTSTLEALITLAIPGNAMGANGSLYFKTLGARTNNADTVIQEVTFGGTEVGLAQTVSVNWYGLERTVMNTGALNHQIAMGATTGGTDAVLAGNGTASFGVGTSNSLNLVFDCQINTATDWCFIYGGKVVVDYAP